MSQRKGMSRFQREKVRIAVEMVLPSINAFIGSSPTLSPNEKKELRKQFHDAFAKLDSATRAER
jgi:hypothetical protein